MLQQEAVDCPVFETTTNKEPTATEKWWAAHNILEKLLGSKREPNQEAETLPAGAD